MIKEFKEFAMRGNVIDLAVGVIIGAAFGKIVSVLVDKVIMPPIGVLLGGGDFSKLAIRIKDGVGEQPPVLIQYGEFLNAVITFFLVTVCVFILIKVMKRMRLKKDITPTPTQSELLLAEIRDLLKKS